MPAGGTWQTPVQLAETNYPLGRPQVAIDSQGDAIAAWTTSNEQPRSDRRSRAARRRQLAGARPDLRFQRRRCAAAGGANRERRRLRRHRLDDVDRQHGRDRGGRAARRGHVADARTDLKRRQRRLRPEQVAIDEHGDVVAVWEHNNGGQEVVEGAQMPTGGSWQSTASQLSESGQSAYNPELLASNPRGDAVVVWERYNGSDQIAQAAQLPAGGSWQSPINISESGADGDAPHVAIDARGDEVAVWTRWNGSTDTAEASELPAGGTWQTPAAASPGAQATLRPAGRDELKRRRGRGLDRVQRQRRRRAERRLRGRGSAAERSLDSVVGHRR